MVKPRQQMRSIKDELDRLVEADLWRNIHPVERVQGALVRKGKREMWNFSGNDYLGLSCHRAVLEAFAEGIGRWGGGATASRLISGSSPAHADLESRLAALKHSETAVLFGSGYAAAVGTIPALLGRDDFVILDKLAHACLIDGSRLSSATVRVFPHNDTSRLEKILRGLRAKHGGEPRILIATESVFSMDGDVAPLSELVRLRKEYDALLLLDEAHGFGVLGEQGAGLAELFGLQNDIDLQMGTLSKAAGLSGGFIATSRMLADLLIQRARSFIYSTAPPPALAHAACAAVTVISSDEGRTLRRKLQENITQLSAGGGAAVPATPIIPVILGTNERALGAAAKLEQQNLLVPAIRYPTVARNTARLRISLSASHPPEAIQQLKTALQNLD
jgi:8-amino-7-oxononanoate synthase